MLEILWESEFVLFYVLDLTNGIDIENKQNIVRSGIIFSVIETEIS